jgi:hypothetical protein
MNQHFPDDCTNADEASLRRGFKYSIYDKMPGEAAHGSQRHVILGELALSMTTNLTQSEISQLRYPATRQELLDEKWSALSEAIRDIASTFHLSAIPELPNETVLFYQDLEKFRGCISQLDEAVRKRLVRAFGFVWGHQGTWNFIREGQWPKVYQENYVSLSKDELEGLGHKYLTEMKLTSPSLEWALINAIVYLTVTGYANTCHFSWRLPRLKSGQSIEGPLLGLNYDISIREKYSGWKAAVLNILAHGVGRLIGNIFNLIFSALFAWAITFWTHNSLITWMVFIASAASTWIVMGVRNHRNQFEDDDREAKRTMVKLLWDLSSAHDRLSRRDFHVGNVRHLLYRLEERNISFGATVFHLLDKREGRQITPNS